MTSPLPLWLFPTTDALTPLGIAVVIALVATTTLGLAATLYRERQRQRRVVAVAREAAEHRGQDEQIDHFAGMPVEKLPRLLMKKR